MYVFVLDEDRQPLNPVSSSEADSLLKKGKAAIFRQFPKTIILKQPDSYGNDSYRLKIYPGTAVTGLAVLNDRTGEVVFAAQLEHRGQEIKQKLLFRSKCRRRRRNANLRYRQPRFSNRKASNPTCRICGSNAVHSLSYCRSCYAQLKNGEVDVSVMGAKSLFPSVESRCQNIFTWVKKVVRLCPVEKISFELTRYDLDHIKSWVHDVTLSSKLRKAYFYELREYLLNKWQKKCVICGKKRVSLKIDSIPSDEKSLNNYILICPECLEIKNKGELKLEQKTARGILDTSEELNIDEKVINLSRNRILYLIKQLNIPLEICSGGVTRLNTRSLGLKNFSWQRAVCIGTSTPSSISLEGIDYVLNVKSIGHGSRKMCTGYQINEKTNPETGRKFTPKECGYFPMNHRPKGNPRENYFGFKTGDVVKFSDPRKNTGKEPANIGIVLKTWDSGKITLLVENKKMEPSHKNCKILQRSDGYFYSLQPAY